MKSQWMWVAVIVIIQSYFTSARSVDVAPNTDRRKRSYYLSQEGNPSYDDYPSFTQFKPPMYALSRPYVIHVYGAPGRIPMYFPPQLLNPGTPVDNPTIPRENILPQTSRPPYQGPTYLPPTYLPPKTDRPMIVDKFGMDEESGPIWGGGNRENNKVTTPRPSATRPTRLPPSNSESAPLPPLVHGGSSGGSNQLSGTPESEVRPVVQQRPPTRPPQAAVNQPSQTTPQGPSNCVWAIVSCCTVSSSRVVDACFEQRGCPGPFWGRSPCEGDFARAALENTLNYYNP